MSSVSFLANLKQPEYTQQSQELVRFFLNHNMEVDTMIDKIKTHAMYISKLQGIARNKIFTQRSRVQVIKKLMINHQKKESAACLKLS